MNYKNPPRQAICRRYISGGVRMRELECGHRTREPDGGKAKYAQFAFCVECAKPPLAEQQRRDEQEAADDDAYRRQADGDYTLEP